jgi:AcrR family transcriptional regulator
MRQPDTPAPQPGERRRPRSDRRRNRARLLAAARHAFDELGPDAPLDEIARRAGVGNATLYRHFPTRGELIVAVYAEEIGALRALGRELLDAPSPDDALFTWLRRFVTHVAAKRDLALAITDDHDGRRSALYDDWHRAMHQAASALLARAQRADTVRADVDPTDLLALANAIALTRPDAGQVERLLRILRHGTTPGPGPDPAVPPRDQR